MAARAISSATISFGLVSIPVKLFTATSSHTVRFNMLHEKCGGRLKQQLYCPVDDEIVDRKDTVKGYEYSRGQYVMFSAEELKKLEADRTNSIDIVEFVPIDQVDLVQVEKSYYLGPDKGGDKAYQLLSESMKRKGRVALGRYAARGKEYLVVIRPYKEGLLLHQLYYADEVRSFDDIDLGAQLSFKEIEHDLAEQLIEQLASNLDLEQYHDRYADQVKAAVEEKVAGKEITVAPEQPKAQIIDLFEALKRSIADGEPAPAGGDKAETDGAASAPKVPVRKAKPRKKAAKKKQAG